LTLTKSDFLARFRLFDDKNEYRLFASASYRNNNDIADGQTTRIKE
jgi:hypothetical protein